MLHLLLARHGETLWNAQRRFQGHADPQLSAEGLRQATALRETLRARAIDAAYSSDLGRALETAEIVCGPRALPIERTPALRELAFGRWEGLTYDEIERESKSELQAWLADRLQGAPPEGESLAQLNARLQPFMNMLRQRHLDKTVLLVAHSGTLRLLLATALGLKPEAHWQFRINPGSLSELDLDPAGATLIRLNHVAAFDDLRALDCQGRRADQEQ